MRSRLVLGLAVAVGCGSFSEGRDSPSPGTDAGAIDASGDAIVPADAGDASGDDDGGIPAPKPCANLVLCDDFERLAVADPRWTDVASEGGTTLTISTGQWKSATRSMLVELPPSVAADRRARLEKTIMPKARRVTARFWLYAASLALDGDILFARMRTEQGHVFLMFQGGKLAMSAGTLPSGSDSGKAETSLAIGQWYEVAFDYQAGLTPKATVVIGGAKLELEITAGGGDVVAFEIGATFAEAGGPSAYFIDDVNIDRGL